MESQVLMTMASLPSMKNQAFGRVINASSISGSIADVGLIGYGCSKAVVNMFIKIVAVELAPYRITVNAYAPGQALQKCHPRDGERYKYGAGSAIGKIVTFYDAARMIDISAVRTGNTLADIKEMADIARQYRFINVHNGHGRLGAQLGGRARRQGRAFACRIYSCLE
jgi:NAD(P)-dependent dehydrogenase (short-subunit alcohol dehydrogenase family)